MCAMVIRPLRPHPIDEQGWRECALSSCAAKFLPDTPSRAFCGDPCAIASMYLREGRPVPVRVVPTPAPRPPALVRTPVSPPTVSTPIPAPQEPHIDREARYGPMRDVVEELSRQAKSKSVRLSCGHVGKGLPLGAKRMRCRSCGKGVPV
mgnify:CR=1 FL=1